jgi:hypothetical protein
MVDGRLTGVNMEKWFKHRKNKVPKKDVTLVPLCQPHTPHVLAFTPHTSWLFQTSWSRVLLEKLTNIQLVKKFPAFYGTRRFITAFTKHATRPYSEPDLSSPRAQPTSWRFISVLFSHLRLGLPNGLSPSGFPIKTLFAPLLTPTHATCSAHFFLLELLCNMDLKYANQNFYILSRYMLRTSRTKNIVLITYVSIGTKFTYTT